MLKDVLLMRNLSVYQVSKESDIPYSTLNDIFNDKTSLKKCSFETVCKLAKALKMSLNEMEKAIYKSKQNQSIDFEVFKSTFCHMLVEKNDYAVLLYVIENNLVEKYWKKTQVAESLYLLSLIDYLSDKNNIPRVKDYDEIRNHKLDKILFPKEDVLLSKINKQKLEIPEDAIPQFLEHNIVEVNVYDAK